MKMCAKCGRRRRITSFYRATNTKDGLRAYCIPCHKEQVAKSRRPYNPVKQRDKNLRRKFGITLADYEEMLAAQGGGCAICGTTDRQLHVDHCHATGVVRGVLCQLCNQGLGQFGDDIGLMKRAIAYLGGTHGT